MKNKLNLIATVFTDEINKIRKDAGALLILVFALIIYPIVYSTAYKNNVLVDVPIAYIDNDNTALSRTALSMINRSQEIELSTRITSLQEGKQLVLADEVAGVIHIPKGFEENIYKGISAPVNLYSDAAYFLKFKQSFAGTLRSVATLGAGVEIKRLMAKGQTPEQAYVSRAPISSTFYMLYNQSSGYASYVMPGLILIIIQQTLLVGIGLVGGSSSELYEHAELKHSGGKVGAIPIILGRTLAYFSISVLNLILSCVIIYNWFDFIHEASYWDLFLYLIPFILSTIFLGITISQVFKRREHSIMFLVFLSPVVLFISGISWPVHVIPKPVYALSQLFPSTFAVPGYLRLRIMGVEFSQVAQPYIGMLVQMLVYFCLAILTVRKKQRKHLTASK